VLIVSTTRLAGLDSMHERAEAVGGDGRMTAIGALAVADAESAREPRRLDALLHSFSALAASP